MKRKAIQIIIPLFDHNDYAEAACDEDDDEGSGDTLSSRVLDVVDKLGELLSMYAGGGSSTVFSGSKSVGLVDIDEKWNVIQPKKKKRLRK